MQYPGTMAEGGKNAHAGANGEKEDPKLALETLKHRVCADEICMRFELVRFHFPGSAYQKSLSVFPVSPKVAAGLAWA